MTKEEKAQQRFLDKVKKRIEEIKEISTKEVNLIIADAPRASKRPRKGKYSFYVPDAAKNKKDIQKLIQGQIDENFNKAISEVYIDIKCYIPTLSNFSKVDTELAEQGYIRPITKPDVDNYMKTYLDAFNGLLWEDDGQIVDGRLRKYYSKDARVEIKIKYKQDFTSAILRRYWLGRKK